MGYGGFEMGFFWYAGYEFQKVGGKSGMRDWATPPGTPPLRTAYFCVELIHVRKIEPPLIPVG